MKAHRMKMKKEEKTPIKLSIIIVLKSELRLSLVEQK